MSIFKTTAPIYKDLRTAYAEKAGCNDNRDVQPAKVVYGKWAHGRCDSLRHEDGSE